MIGILNNAMPLRGFNLLKYQKLGSQILHYKGSNAWVSLTKPIASSRDVSQHVKPPSAKALRLQTAHGVPLSYDIIYNSFEYHTILQHFSVGMTIAGAIFSLNGAIFNTEEFFPDLFQTLWTLYIGSLFFYINIGSTIIAYKSPTRIYHNKDTGDYKAVFNDIVPTKIRTLEFRKGQVHQVPPRDFFTLFKYHKFKIKDQNLYMFDFYFRYPGDLYGMFDEIEEEGEVE